jgi:hypothetical protein
LKISDLKVRILENTRKMKAVVCGGRTRTKWRMGNYERNRSDFVRKCFGFSELRQIERRNGNWLEKARADIC